MMLINYVKMAIKKVFWIWTGINILWWVLSVSLDIYCGIDVNPFLGDVSETILNVWVYVIGCLLIMITNIGDTEKKESDNDD